MKLLASGSEQREGEGEHQVREDWELLASGAVREQRNGEGERVKHADVRQVALQLVGF